MIYNFMRPWTAKMKLHYDLSKVQLMILVRKHSPITVIDGGPCVTTWLVSFLQERNIVIKK